MIPVNDLKRGFFRYQNEFENKALEVLRSGWYILGNEVKEFEKNFANQIGVNYCVGVDNGLNAIALGIKALDIGCGDEVIIQANTYIATVLGATMNGATPVFVEPDDYYNMDADKIEEKITSNTKAVLVTHLYGQATRMDKINEICKKHNLYLLEDCAQSHFSTYKKQITGSFGILGFFSFYPTKNIGAMGDAGAVVTNDSKLEEKIRMLRNYGSIKRYENEIEGNNSRLDEIQAGLLNIKLRYAEELTKERQSIAEQYLKRIRNPQIILPRVAPQVESVWHLFVVRTENREKLKSYLKNNGVSADVHYPTPPHLSKAYRHLGYQKGAFEKTENFAQHILSLPLFNGMEQNEISKVIEVVNSYEDKR